MRRAWLDSINAMIGITLCLIIYSLIANDCNWGDVMLATASGLAAHVIKTLNPWDRELGEDHALAG